MTRRAAVLSLAILLGWGFAIEGGAQVQQGTIEGDVLNPDGTPVDGATVTLLDHLGVPIATTRSQAGAFRLANLAPGAYALRAEAAPLLAAVQAVAVRDALPVRVELRLAASAAEQVIVRSGDLEAVTVTGGVTLAGDALRRAPVRVRSRALQGAVAATPGWATEDNGLLHVRGVDDGFLYVIDGVPVYERLDGLFGMAPDPAMIDSVNVLTGYIPPEFGFKAGGVIEVRSAGRAADGWLGAIDGGLGSDAARDVSVIAGGPLGRSTALTLGAGGERSARFLDPVHPRNLHNTGGAWSGGAQFGWTVSPSTLLTAVGGAGQSEFDVPHGEQQEEAGQDQRQRLLHAWQTLSLQHVWSANTVSQAAGYHRFGSAALEGSTNDVPLFTNADRTLRRAGALASVTHQAGRHAIKIGGEVSRLGLREAFSFAVTDVEEAEEAGLGEAALAFTAARPFRFQDRAGAELVSAYAQDSIHAGPRLTVDFGLRADWSRLLIAASQLSPRLGAAYHVAASGTTLRLSAGRFFQPPQAENLLLASSPQARALSPFARAEHEGGAELRPERQTALDAGVGQAIGRHLRAGVVYWRRWVTHAADPNVFFGTTIVFANTVAKGRASGVELRVEMPRVGGWSAYANYTRARVTQFGPIEGGLFLEDDVIEIGAGTPFTPDHDQRHVAAFGLNYELTPAGLSWSATGRYESGTPLEVDEDGLDELAERPGAGLADFDRGRVKPRHVYDVAIAQRLRRAGRVDLEARLSVLNLLGGRFAYNFGNPFSGTHFGPGRTLKAGIRAAFR